MKVTIFGPTGRTGRLLVEQALQAGHEVTAFARDPQKLGLAHERLRVVQGDLNSAETVEQAVAGSQAVLSVLGPSRNEPVFEISRGMENILKAMHKHGVRRLVVSSGAGVEDPGDRPGLPDKMIKWLLKRTARWVYEDMQRMVKTVIASGVDWTIVRVPMLVDGPASSRVKVGYVGKGTGPRLSRADLATFMLQQLDSNAYQKKAPVISS